MLTRMLMTVAMTVALAAGGPLAHAHGAAKAKHGGVVSVVSDLAYELVATPGGASIYIDDHGKAVTPAGYSGKLTVLNGADKSEAVLTVAGDKLEAKGVNLSAGAKAVAALTTKDKKAVTVRFTVK